MYVVWWPFQLNSAADVSGKSFTKCGDFNDKMLCTGKNSKDNNLSYWVSWCVPVNCTRKHAAQDITEYKTSEKLIEVHPVLEQYIKLEAQIFFQLDKQACVFFIFPSPDAEFAKQVNSNYSKLISLFFKY